jgi:hypothetical protein
MRSVLWCFLALNALAVGVSARRCSLMAAPALKSTPPGVVYQETLDSLMSRLDSFLDSQNVTFAPGLVNCNPIAAAAVSNSTVLSGWVQSQNRFGLCYSTVGSDIAGGVFSTAAAAALRNMACDQDPSVIGYLQTLSMQWVCQCHYQAPTCDWSPSYGASAIQFEPRPNYVPGSAGGGSEATTSGATMKLSFAPLVLTLISLANVCYLS